MTFQFSTKCYKYTTSTCAQESVYGTDATEKN